MKQNSLPLPSFLLNLFERIDHCGDEPIIIRQEDIPTADRNLFLSLIRQGLLKEAISQTMACISCDGKAEISRSGQHGKKLIAICGECACVFPLIEKDRLEYRTDFLTTANWLINLLNQNEEPELVCDQAYYIGEIKSSTIKREVYFSRDLSGSNSETCYNEISKSIRHQGIVISLSKLPEQPKNKSLTTLPISSLFSQKDGSIGLETNQLFRTQTNSTKSRAARDRWDKDPLQAQKEIFKTNITRKLATEFREPLTHDQIYKAAKATHPAWLTYTNHKGEKKMISDRISLSLVVEVLEGLGQQHRINGKYHRK